MLRVCNCLGAHFAQQARLARPTFVSSAAPAGKACFQLNVAATRAFGRSQSVLRVSCFPAASTSAPHIRQCLQAVRKLYTNAYHSIPRLQSLQTLRTSWQRAVRTNLAKNSSQKLSQSSVCVLAPLAAALGIGGACLLRGGRVADCKAKNRLVGSEGNENGGEEPPFPWIQLLELLLADIWLLVLAVLCAIGAAVANIQAPMLLGEITNVVTKFTSDAYGGGNFLDEISEPAWQLMKWYCLQGLFTFSYITLLSIVGENLANRMKNKLFNAYLQQDIVFFDSHKTGELMDRLTSDVQDFKSSFKLCISQGLKAATQTVGCVMSLLLISPKLSGIMLIVLPTVIGGGTLLGGILRKFSREAQDQVARSSSVADEAISNIRTVRAFAMEGKESEIYAQQLCQSRMLNVKLGVGIGAFQGLTNIFLNAVVLGSMFAGGWLISLGELSAGDLMSFLVGTQTIQRSLAQMSILFGTMVRGMSAGARVFEFIDAKPAVGLHAGKCLPFHTLLGEIEFKDVAFSYPTRPGQVVLHDFSLKIPGGGMVALVGLSGGGKSTVAALLERFYDVTHGSITLDGEDIRDLNPSWLRGHAIGYINQEPVLFATSVMENIRYGRPDASDQEVIEAATLANADGFIRKFPEGYNTVLGERGVTVSGGQKQRIAIARALIKNPSILVLDEATSALDAESERVVQEALDKVSKGRTVLVIAHRLSTIRDADIIAVVSHGKIVELGNHKTLKNKKGLYWELIKQQEIEEELDHTPAA